MPKTTVEIIGNFKNDTENNLFLELKNFYYFFIKNTDFILVFSLILKL